MELTAINATFNKQALTDGGGGEQRWRRDKPVRLKTSFQIWLKPKASFSLRLGAVTLMSTTVRSIRLSCFVCSTPGFHSPSTLVSLLVMGSSEPDSRLECPEQKLQLCAPLVWIHINSLKNLRLTFVSVSKGVVDTSIFARWLSCQQNDPFKC